MFEKCKECENCFPITLRKYYRNFASIYTKPSKLEPTEDNILRDDLYDWEYLNMAFEESKKKFTPWSEKELEDVLKRIEKKNKKRNQ